MKHKLIPVGLLSLLFLCLAGASIWTKPTQAAMTFIVNSSADTVDAGPGDGICAAALGECTLRAAIIEANALPGDDIITLPEGIYVLTIPGINEDASATGDLDITSSLTINGAGVASTIIDGNGSALNDRVVHVIGSITVTISGLSISGGRATTGPGGFPSGGGILNDGTLTLASSTIISNTSIASGIITSYGGGIWNMGALTVAYSTFSGNSADYGGASGNGGMLTVISSTFSDNNGGNTGGGIYNNGAGTLIVTHSTFSGNIAGAGGGIANNGTLTVTHSTFSDNEAGGGAGMYNNGTLTVINSTFSDNTADSGGGLVNIGMAANLTVIHSTFSGNSAFYNGGGIWNASSITATTLYNTIIANSQSGGNCVGEITNGGGNLSWPDTTCPGQNTNPRLGPLANNGGQTETHALLLGSAAIDVAEDDNCPATDQRDITRPQGTHCDIGAYEIVVADLAVAKTDSPDPVKRGSSLTYNVVVRNNGPSSAAGILLTDTLPTGVEFGSALPGQGSCTGTSIIICSLGALSASSATTVTVIVTPTVGGSITNTASVSSNVVDPNPTNNTETENTTVLLANLSVTKTDSPDPVRLGQVLTYTLIVNNNGPSNATGVLLHDLLPTGVMLMSESVSQGGCGGTGLVTCSLNTINAGLNATVTLIVTPTSTGLITNNVNITGNEEDPDLSNNTDSETTMVKVYIYLPTILK